MAIWIGLLWRAEFSEGRLDGRRQRRRLRPSGADDGGEMPEEDCIRRPADSLAQLTPSHFCAVGGPGVGWMRDRLRVNRQIVTSAEVSVIMKSVLL
jgi:hypothetical protein